MHKIKKCIKVNKVILNFNKKISDIFNKKTKILNKVKMK